MPKRQLPILFTNFAPESACFMQRRTAGRETYFYSKFGSNATSKIGRKPLSCTEFRKLLLYGLSAQRQVCKSLHMDGEPGF
jgi:hypothetical protein